MCDTLRDLGCANELRSGTGSACDGVSRQGEALWATVVLEEQGRVLSFESRGGKGRSPREENSKGTRWNDDRLMCNIRVQWWP